MMLVMNPSNPRPAATVVLLRDGPQGPETFLVRRHEGTAFMGGAYVFPGGRVDAGDRSVADETWCDGLVQARRLGTLAAGDAVAFHIAAARELFEEAGVLLARGSNGEFAALSEPDERSRFRQYRFDVHASTRPLRDVIERERLRLAMDALVPFANWVTPPIDVRQFDTWFFVTRVPPRQTPVHDERETTDSTWMRPADAIAAALHDEILLPVPTWTTLRELEPFARVDDALTWARARAVVRRQPLLVEEDGVRMLLLPGDPLHPEMPVEELASELRFAHVDGRWRARRTPRRIGE
jgi:8-oxo-dGTP pyrophosphatase MutT (NUDIX family)